MKIINFFSSLIEWLGLAFSFLFAWVWTMKTDGVDTVDDDHINDLQDLKVDTNQVPILQNILGGSSFGVWSQSDADKGIGYLDFDSGSVVPVVGETLTGATSGTTGKVMWVDVTGGTWGGGDAVGTVYLGECSTDCFNDNENVNGSAGGGNILTVNQPDGAVGADGHVENGAFVTDNDPPNDWTASNATLSTEAGGSVGNCLKVLDGGAGNGYGYQQITTVVGKIYKFSCWAKDIDAGQNGLIEVGTSPGNAAYYSSGAITDDAGDDYTVTFEATTTTTFISLNCTSAAGAYYFDEVTLYEITPCCTAANSVTFDGEGGWTKDITVDIYRQHNDGGTLTKDGSFYSLKCVPSAADDFIYFPKDAMIDNVEWMQKFAGRTVSFGMWVKTSTASHAKIGIFDTAYTYSSFHTGGGDWEWIEVTKAIDATPAQVYFIIRFDQAPNIDGSTIVYVSQPMLIFSKGADAIIGEGNYTPKSQEMIWLEKNIPSNGYDGLLNQSDLAYTDLNLEADSDAMLPKGAKMIAVLTDIEDSGSGAGLDVHLELRKDATAGTFFINSVAGKPNDIHNHVSGLQPCDVNGDVDIHLDASGANTLDINTFEYHGIQIS